jgi:hypothetical protein
MKLGCVVHESNGYAVVEVLDPLASGDVVIGYSLAGPQASPSIIYSNRMEALEALHDIEDRTPES